MNLELAALHAPSSGSGTRFPERTGDERPASGVHRPLNSEDYQHLGAEELIRWAGREFGEGLVLSSSFGADSPLMLHLVSKFAPGTRVVFIDTGYLFPETYRFGEELRERFNLKIEVYGPKMSTARQEALYGQLWEQGDEGVRRYLQMNKVEPMQRALQELKVTAWIAAVRASQTEHRQGLRKVGLQDGRVKIHPILDWSKEQVDDYFRQHDLPRHPLYEQGYRSIGDWHSTVPVAPGEDDRSGRFLGAKKECGLHLSAAENTSFSSSGL
jgi:phosphoadenosine phosphosulfate reductase